MRFAYFGRPRGKVPVEKYIQDMQEDAREWLYRSKLPPEDRKASKIPTSHESMHSLIDPLKQPTRADIRKHYVDNPNLPKLVNRRNAYRDAQLLASSNDINYQMEKMVTGLEGFKPTSFTADRREYWKGRRIRKKGFPKNYITAANLVDLYKQDWLSRQTPSKGLFDDFLGIDYASLQRPKLDPRDSYLLRRAVIHNQKLSPKTIHRLLSRYGKLLSNR